MKYSPYSNAFAQHLLQLEREREDWLRRQAMARALMQGAGGNPHTPNEISRYRNAIDGRLVDPSIASKHPKSTEFDRMQVPSIKNGPTRFVNKSTDTGWFTTDEFARQNPNTTVHTRVPDPKKSSVK